MDFIPCFPANGHKIIRKHAVSIYTKNFNQIIAVLEVIYWDRKSLREIICRFRMMIIYHSKLPRDIQICAWNFRCRNVVSYFGRGVGYFYKRMNFIPRFSMNADDIICRLTINICSGNCYQIITIIDRDIWYLKIENWNWDVAATTCERVCPNYITDNIRVICPWNFRWRNIVGNFCWRVSNIDKRMDFIPCCTIDIYDIVGHGIQQICAKNNNLIVAVIKWNWRCPWVTTGCSSGCIPTSSRGGIWPPDSSHYMDIICTSNRNGRFIIIYHSI